MLALTRLRSFARAAAALLGREKDLGAFEVYCSTSEHRVVRLNYTSDIPSRGVEEFKSLNVDGFAIRIVMRRDPHEIAAASEAGDLSLEAVREVLKRARRATVIDPHFPGLPAGPRKLAAIRRQVRDLAGVRDSMLAHAAWGIVGSAVGAFASATPLKLARPGLVLGGDLSLIRDRIAIAGSAFDDIRSDENAYFTSSVTVLVEALKAKGTATAIGGTLAGMRRAAAGLGREAVWQALKLRNGERPHGGPYRLVLGPQPVAEILNYMVIPSLTTGAFQAGNSAYHGRFGAPVMDQRLALADDAALGDGAIGRTITCEALPAGRTDLIRDGRLVGLLSNFYDAHRLLTDEHRREKLGPAAGPELSFPATSGYRLGEAAARRFDASPASGATNVILSARGGVPDQELIASVGEGIYVGRVWYTYPINGQRAGDFTCTISGDSYLIKGGRIAAPLEPNALRINANLEEVFAAPLAVGRQTQAAIVWGSPEAYYVPALATPAISLDVVAGGPEEG